MSYSAEQLIEILHLEPHPEGGWYAFCQSSKQRLPLQSLPEFGGVRESTSVIYYMLKKGEISRWHQLRATEVWTWHQGGSLLMTLGGTGELPAASDVTLALGPRLDQGEQFQIMAPPDYWQTTRVVDGDFVLVSCVVSPGYVDEDCLLPEEPLDNEIYG